MDDDGQVSASSDSIDPSDSPHGGPIALPSGSGGGGGVRLVDRDDKEDDGGMDDDGQVSARGHPVPDIVDTPDSIDTTTDSPHGGPQRSIGGWIIRVWGVQEDAQEADIRDAFSGFGQLGILHLNQGHALLEYDKFEEAQTAVKEMNGKQLLKNIINVDWAFRRGSIQKAMSTRSGFPYPLDIVLAVRRSVQPFQHIEDKARKVFAQHSHKEDFLHEGHSKMVPNFDELQALGPHPLLEVQTASDTSPDRWIHGGINAEGTNHWIVLFMRIDNLYTRGFENQHKAYEITEAPLEKGEIKAVQPSILPPSYNCTLLNWDVTYSELFGVKNANDLEVELQKIARDPDFVFEGVTFLSNYKHTEDSEDEAEAKKKLGAIIFFLCEFIRMNLSSDTPGEVPVDLLEKAQTWGDVCIHLLKWRSNNFEEWYTSRDYKNKPQLFTRLKNIHINSAFDALKLEHLILNRSALQLANEEKNRNDKSLDGSRKGYKGDWKSLDKKETQRRRKMETQVYYLGAGAAKSGYCQLCQGAPLEDGANFLQLGRRRIQLISLSSNFAVDWVDVHDWHRTQAIYRKEIMDSQVKDNSETDLAMVGPRRPIGAYSVLGLEFCYSNTSTRGQDKRIANPTTQKGSVVKYWPVDNFNDEQPTIHFKDIDGLFENEKIRIGYMLVPNTVEARVMIQLYIKGAGIRDVTGLIEAWDKSTEKNHILLFSQQTVNVKAGEWTPFPLMVSLLCLPYVEDLKLDIATNLTIQHRSNSSQERSLQFHLKLSQKETTYQDVAGNKIKVTLHLAKEKSPVTLHPQPRKKVQWRHPSTKWAQRSDKVYLTIELPDDAKYAKLHLTPDGNFYFSAKGSDEIQYELDLDLFDAVNVEESKECVTPRSICYLVKKAETKWWPRLLKGSRRGRQPVFLKIDSDRFTWRNLDDERAECGGDSGDVGFSKLNMGGLMTAMMMREDEDDDDDDDQDR